MQILVLPLPCPLVHFSIYIMVVIWHSFLVSVSSLSMLLSLLTFNFYHNLRLTTLHCQQVTGFLNESLCCRANLGDLAIAAVEVASRMSGSKNEITDMDSTWVNGEIVLSNC